MASDLQSPAENSPHVEAHLHKLQARLRAYKRKCASIWCPKRDSNSHDCSLEPKSSASTNSAIRAITYNKLLKNFFICMFCSKSLLCNKFTLLSTIWCCFFTTLVVALQPSHTPSKGAGHCSSNVGIKEIFSKDRCRAKSL
jgi:hypothetical protein